MTTLIKHNKPNRGDEIIIPYLAIENNINFIMLNGGVGDVELMDGTKCKSTSCTSIKFDDAGDDIYRIYGIGKEAWKMAWLKRVHAMSDEIVKLKLDFNASN